jgi:hypothetical protein
MAGTESKPITGTEVARLRDVFDLACGKLNAAGENPPAELVEEFGAAFDAFTDAEIAYERKRREDLRRDLGWI